MELTIFQCRPIPLCFSSDILFVIRQKNLSALSCRGYRMKLSCQKGRRVSASSSRSSPNEPEGFSWLRLSQSISRGSERLLQNFNESLKKETGFSVEDAKVRVSGIKDQARESFSKGQEQIERVNSELLPQLIDWNKWDYWKDVKSWEPKRFCALILYIFVVVLTCRGTYKAIRAPFIEREKRDLTEAYMEALIPVPSPANIRQFKKGLWRKTTPKGLKLKKFVEGPDGKLVHDSSFVGEDAWDDSTVKAEKSVKEIMGNDQKLNAEDKKSLKQSLGLSGFRRNMA